MSSDEKNIEVFINLGKINNIDVYGHIIVNNLYDINRESLVKRFYNTLKAAELPEGILIDIGNQLQITNNTNVKFDFNSIVKNTTAQLTFRFNHVSNSWSSIKVPFNLIEPQISIYLQNIKNYIL